MHNLDNNRVKTKDKQNEKNSVCMTEIIYYSNLLKNVDKQMKTKN